MSEFQRYAVPEMSYGHEAERSRRDETARRNREKLSRQNRRRAMWYTLRWYIAWFVGVSGTLALCGVGLPRLLWVSDRYECAKAAENADVQTKFVDNHFYSWDCYVKVGDNWIPFDKWRGIDQ